ncbi:MAG: M56 family metallopeptidase, partial [Verrucomicrobiales bacterium]|nr:M56 family metallopeptidase [Verrucomicrobiales bacterium]
MQTWFDPANPFFSWLGRGTWQVALLVVLVFVVQGLFHKRLSPHWRYNLWLLVVIRLALPISPESALSIFNLAKVVPDSARPVLPTVLPAVIENHPWASEAGPNVSVTSPPTAGAESPESAYFDPANLVPSRISEPVRRPISLRALIPWVWLSGLLALAGGVLMGNVRLWRALRSASLVREPRVLALLRECQEAMRASRPLTILETDAVKSPALFGWLRPKLLLPPAVLREFSTRQLRHVLFHELAHLKRGDIAMNWLMTALQLVHWFNPVVWFGFARMRTDRELACDALALSHAVPGENMSYGDTIIRLVEGFQRPVVLPSLLGILEDTSQMKRRIRMIARFGTDRPWRVFSLLLVALLGLITLTDAQTKTRRTDPAEQAPPDSATSAEMPELKVKLTLRVVDANTGAPLPGTKVQANYFYAGSGMEGHNLRTDAERKVAIPGPDRPTRDAGMNIFVTAENHVPKVVSWRGGSVPAEYVFKLEAALTIGGKVVDESGRPVPGVKLNVNRPGMDGDWSLEHIDFPPRDSTVQTDENGRWSLSYIPKHYDKAGLQLTHPDFMVTRADVPVGRPESTSATLVIQRGFIVSGTVKDNSGQPVTDATVREVNNFGRRNLSAKTSADGAFTLKGVTPGELQLIVQAKGFAPQAKRLEMSADNHGVEFILGPGKIFRGRVLDEEGEPIAGAVAQTDWDNQGLRKIEWETKTDAEGRFEWDSAPAEPLLFWFEANGYNWSRGLLLTPDGTEHEITLTRKTPTRGGSFDVTGQVKDVETGGAIPDFKVLLGEVRSPDFPPDFRSSGTHGANGEFRLTISTPCFFPSYVVQVQADGYLPAVSTNLAVAAGAQKVELALKKGAGPSGVVRLPDGQPVEGALVFLCGLQGGVYMEQPGQVRLEVSKETPHVRTDANGHFAFSPTIDAHTLIAVHDAAYSEIRLGELENSLNVVLQPYGRVEGTLFAGTNPVSNETISLGTMYYRYGDGQRHFPPLSLWLAAKTDSNGRFVLEKVPPGERKIWHRLSFRDGKPGTIPSSHGFPVTVKAGETLRVTIGGTGRPIIGRAVVPDHPGVIDWQNDVQKLSLVLPEPVVRPERSAFDSGEAFDDAIKEHVRKHKEFWLSDEGRRLERAIREYVPVFDSNGFFRIEDVPSGTYKLSIRVTESF